MLPVLALAGGGRIALQLAKKGLDVLAGVAGTVRKNVPTLDDSVVVEVQGQPGASKQELYYLALAAANGVVRRQQPLIVRNPLNAPSYGLIQIDYDATSNWIRCTLHYKVGCLAGNVEEGPNGKAKGNVAFFNSLAVYRGPQCGVVGAPMDFKSSFLAGIPNGADESPQLVWAGHTIVNECPQMTTPAPVPITQNPPEHWPILDTHAPATSTNPKPPGDNRSRGSVIADATSQNGYPYGTWTCCPKGLNLVQLVFAALTDPGGDAYLTWAGPQQGPLGT